MNISKTDMLDANKIDVKINARIIRPSGSICEIEKNLMNDGDIEKSSIICHNPPKAPGIITSMLKLFFKALIILLRVIFEKEFC